MQHKKLNTWVEMWVTAHISEIFPSNQKQDWLFFHAKMQLFLCFDFLNPFRIRDSFCWISNWITKQEENLFLFMSGVGFTDLCVSLCAQTLLYTYNCHKKKNVYAVLTSIDTQGSKVFRPVQKGYLALWIGFKYFYYLSDDTNAVSVMHADEITKWSKQVLTVLWDVFCDLSLCMDSHKNRLLVKGVSVPYHCGQINQ